MARATRPEPTPVIPHGRGGIGMRPSVALALILLITLLLSAVLLAAQYGVSGGVSCERLAPGSGLGKTRAPCAPNLPNDHCR